MEIKLPTKIRGRPKKGQKEAYLAELEAFAKQIQDAAKSARQKASSRGWCYLLEGFGVIDKSQFDACEGFINEARKEGILPIDFVLEEAARAFDGLETIDDRGPRQFLADYLEGAKDIYRMYEGVSFWEAQPVYIQMLVEKIDLKQLFRKITRKYHIPIATSRGWYSILQRAEMAKRFKFWEERGKAPVLLYCGDHDPTGLQISEALISNFWDITKGTKWEPTDLIVDRFGLNYTLIMEANLTWIDNLISASGRPPDLKKAFVRDYIAQYGERKVEANALVIRPDLAEELVEQAILKYVPEDGFAKYQYAKLERQGAVRDLQDKIGLESTLDDLIVELE
ncbi:hypothetical protein ES708_00009 [subsurface metagenome]